MQIEFINKQKSNKLLLFFTGWGHCPNTLSQIKTTGFDVAVAFDYRQKPNPTDLQKIINLYDEVHLLAWSFGVFVANEVLQGVKLHSSIAINGSISPISNDKGIPIRIFNKTLQTITPENLQKFNLRMCNNNEAQAYYSKCKPNRTFAEQKQELQFLKDWATNTPTDTNIFQSAYISSNDKIFTPQNLQNAWEQLLPKSKIKIMEAPHFPFYLHNDILEILNLW